MKILIVEDSKLSANKMLNILSTLKYGVDWYKSATEVLEKEVDLNSYDMLIIDLVLEGSMNGLDLAKHVRSFVNRPIVLMSTFSHSGLMEQSTEFNPEAFIVKPFNLEQVKTAIQMALYKYSIKKSLEEKENLLVNLKQKQIEMEIEGREAERKRVASELHDGLGQMLTAIKLNINHLFKYGTVDGAIDDLKKLINETIVETHRISEDLSPSNIEHLNFIECIRALIDNMKKSKLKFHFENYGFPEDLEPGIKINLYRIIQEVLNNTVKHSDASSFNIRLFKVKSLLRIMLEDDGDGTVILNDNVHKGKGIENIKNRVDMLKGEVSIESIAGEGTTVIVELPYF